MVAVTCDTCKKPISKPPSHVQEHNFCGNDCYHEWRKTRTGPLNRSWKGGLANVTCQTCGKVFGVFQALASERRYCSRACKAVAQRADHTCDNCGEHFGGAKQRFCSYTCSLSYFRAHPVTRSAETRGRVSAAKMGSPGLSGAANPHYRHGRASLTEKTCPVCGKGFRAMEMTTFCSRACKAKDTEGRMREYWQGPLGQSRLAGLTAEFAGSRNPNWRGGVGLTPYAPGFVGALKRLIRRRDGNQCRICSNVPSAQDSLAIHHVDGSKSNHRPDNLLLLCRPCHGRVHRCGLICPKPE